MSFYVVNRRFPRPTHERPAGSNLGRALSRSIAGYDENHVNYAIMAKNPAFDANESTAHHSRATVASGFVMGMLSGLSAKGMDIAPLLAAVGLDLDIQHSTARVPLTSYAALYNQVVDRLGDEGFALFSLKLRRGMFEFLCRGMIGSRNLEEALARASSFLRMILPDLQFHVTRHENVASLEIMDALPIGQGTDDPRRVFAFEWLLRLIHGLACWLVNRILPLDTVQFPYTKPAHAADYALIYTEHPHFGGDRLIARLQPHLLALPVRRDPDAVSEFLQGAPGKIAMLYRRDHDVVRQIRDTLVAALPDSLSLDEVADRLHLSLRTIQRRLKEQSSSFRAVKAGLRRNMALSMIQDARQPISEIALELGYAETSAFFRAFVHWTGEAPTTYRKKLRSLTS